MIRHLCGTRSRFQPIDQTYLTGWKKAFNSSNLVKIDEPITYTTLLNAWRVIIAKTAKESETRQILCESER